jgi:hypothetical protein
MRNFIICTLLQALLKCSNEGEDWHVARMWDVRNAYYNLVTKPKGIDNFGDLRVHGMVILKWIWNVCQSQSQSHIATKGQSVSMSWCQAQIWDI